ncbi:tRNA pseudouridine(13) synthase TruD [Thiosulfativibrio zosterae]|uniref:tRNA pseudouridine synthase D n=1 Tax=Thiosulfativibrio zosterae TaxID=2675053 RepID=A0A6F8PKM1_9GAMM|nr:tRNA pseudouridine(13) synthase TruD [Thiosulfativibrio zosterae]BBP42645.1 tRNA pseudouridine synthase D [Thiosulfativibrio zosterae]
MSYAFNQLAYAYGKPECQGQLKAKPEDFQVEEILGFELSGEGEHLWLWVEKRGENTDWVAQQLAKWAGVNERYVGYAGKKDRQAVTRQWFSVHLPGKPNPDLDLLNLDNVEVLKVQRHQKKCQTGCLAGNRFVLVLRDLQGNLTQLQTRLQSIQQQGVPNYFGEQRFGKDMGNLKQAEALFAQLPAERAAKKRHKLSAAQQNQRGLYISAARSWIFNQVLNQRILAKCWADEIEGDLLNLESLPTGPLVGRGRLGVAGKALALETEVMAEFTEWLNALEHLGLQQERRALVLKPQAMTWALQDQHLQLAFSLPAGSYATMLVRELVVASE